MVDDTQLGRRRLLGASGALGSLAAVAPLGPAQIDEVTHKWVLGQVTPGTDSGPFYPLMNKPFVRNADLTTIGGGRARARGRLLHLMGQVLDIKGTPVKGVQVEIWQANSAGRYTHPSDGNLAPLDPNFKGYGITITDSEGRYRFKTIMPGGYPIVPDWLRPPHIHFEVTGRRDRQITQMWFPGNPLNGQDRTLAHFPPAAQQRLICRVEAATEAMEPDSNIARFNIVVPNG